MLGAHGDGHNAWLRRFATVRDVRQSLEGALWRQSQQARCQGVLILRLGATVTRQGPELLGRRLPINCTSRPVRGLQSLSVIEEHDSREKNPSSSLYVKKRKLQSCR